MSMMTGPHEARPQTHNGKNKQDLVVEPSASPSQTGILSTTLESAPQGTNAPDTRLSGFQKFVLSVERGNLMKK